MMASGNENGAIQTVETPQTTYVAINSPKVGHSIGPLLDISPPGNCRPDPFVSKVESEPQERIDHGHPTTCRKGPGQEKPHQHHHGEPEEVPENGFNQ